VVATADLNNDGKLDLVSANKTTSTVTIRYGNGDGTYKVASSYIVGNAPTGLTFDDVNKDGLLDIITADQMAAMAKCCLEIQTELSAAQLPGKMFASGTTKM